MGLLEVGIKREITIRSVLEGASYFNGGIL